MSTREQQARYMARHPEQLEKARIRQRAWRAANRERHRAYSAAYQREHGHGPQTPEQQRRYALTRMGVTEEWYDEQLARQGGGCALCGRSDSGSTRVRYLPVDHDHATGRIRGILCVGCNVSLGYFERGQNSRLDPEKARAYLR